MQAVGTHIRFEFARAPRRTNQNPLGQIGLRLINIFGKQISTKEEAATQSLIALTLVEMNLPLYTYDYLASRAVLLSDGARPASGTSSTYSYHSENKYDATMRSPLKEGTLPVHSEFSSQSWQKYG